MKKNKPSGKRKVVWICFVCCIISVLITQVAMIVGNGTFNTINIIIGGFQIAMYFVFLVAIYEDIKK